MFEFDQILPGCPPCSGTCKCAVGIPKKPFGMIFLKSGTPTGVINHNVEEYASAAKMNGVGQFAKLINAGTVFVEHNQRGIDRRQIERRISAADPAKAGVSGGRRIDRQQM